MKRDYGIFQVGLKILLYKRGKVLLLRDDKGLDLPGGRIDNVEYQTPIEKIIAREVREELGRRVKYTLGKPLFHFRRVRRQKGAHPRFVFLAVYQARWVSGGITLSHEHESYEWIDPKKYILKRSDFGNEEEYRILAHYFKAYA
ncbi:MAG: NUDIX domain-containing protein [Patescibacteria group bacterium]